MSSASPSRTARRNAFIMDNPLENVEEVPSENHVHESSDRQQNGLPQYIVNGKKIYLLPL